MSSGENKNQNEYTKSPLGSLKVATNQTMSPINSLTDNDLVVTPRSPTFKRTNLILVENHTDITNKNKLLAALRQLPETQLAGQDKRTVPPKPIS